MCQCPHHVFIQQLRNLLGGKLTEKFKEGQPIKDSVENFRLTSEHSNEQRQAYEITWERMKERAGARSANSLVSFISHSIDLREKQMDAGVGMGIDSNLNKIKSGRWDEEYVVHLPKEGQAIIIGDIHSRFDCLDHILQETDFVERVKKGEKLYLVFMGDLVDRPRVVGDGGGLKVFEAALSLLNSFPNNVIIEKGNHDGAAEGSLHPQEFYQEVRMKFGEKQAEVVLQKWREFYDKAPIAVKMDMAALQSMEELPELSGACQTSLSQARKRNSR